MFEIAVRGSHEFFVEEPTDSVVARANDAVLGERARRCQEERGLMPNLVAVGFYERGELFAVVDRLNDSYGPSASAGDG